MKKQIKRIFFIYSEASIAVLLAAFALVEFVSGNLHVNVFA